MCEHGQWRFERHTALTAALGRVFKAFILMPAEGVKLPADLWLPESDRYLAPLVNPAALKWQGEPPTPHRILATVGLASSSGSGIEGSAAISAVPA